MTTGIAYRVSGVGGLIIEPRLEASASWARATNIRCGGSVCDVKARRQKGALEMQVWCRVGPPVWVTVSPWLAAAPVAVTIDDTILQPRVTADGDGFRASIEFQASGEHELRFA